MRPTPQYLNYMYWQRLQSSRISISTRLSRWKRASGEFCHLAAWAVYDISELLQEQIKDGAISLTYTSKFLENFASVKAKSR